MGVSFLVCHDTTQKVRCSADAGTQAFDLNDLAVIDEEIYLWPPVFDLAAKDLGICSLASGCSTVHGFP